MKKILLTNFNMVNYSGSELDTLEIAKYFLEKGYLVDIFTLKKGNPLINLINKDIKVITPNEINLLSKSYDLIWAHHYPLLDYILFALKIKSNYIFYISLSAFDPYESIPIYHNSLSLIGAITNEVKNKLIEEGVDEENIFLFPNYATKEYFDYQEKPSSEIKRICIVSNHVPLELQELKGLGKKEGIEVDIFGLQFVEKLIDMNILASYDIIISIGKTIYSSLAMGKPSYVYDLFGGYGYITKENIEKAFNYNFSGRGFGKKLTAQEILNDLKENYINSLKDLKYLKEYARTNFNFSNNMQEILKIIETNKINEQELLKYDKILNRRSILFIREINNLYSKIQELNLENDNLKKEIDFLVPYIEYKNKYNNVLGSTSWKITKPIRKSKEIIYKFKNKLRSGK
ncbi:MAG: hypothetical protein IJ501_06105 [Bacilli bacterium]|nr:hypothetical protein [Bacilli bacterium]